MKAGEVLEVWVCKSYCLRQTSEEKAQREKNTKTNSQKGIMKTIIV